MSSKRVVWLERRRSEKDRRRHALYLTEAGQVKLGEGRQAARGRAEELTSALTPKEPGRLVGSAEETSLDAALLAKHTTG